MKAKDKEKEDKAKRFKPADPKQVADIAEDTDVNEDTANSNDDDFKLDGGHLPSFQFSSPLPSTRSRTASPSPSPTSSRGFPEVPVRFGRRSLNPKIM